MKYTSSILLSTLLTLTTASPLLTRQTPVYPPTSLSSYFDIVVNVTGLDLVPPINGHFLAAYQIAAGQDYVSVVPNTTIARVFYQNGTAEQVRYGQATIQTDSGEPPLSYGLNLPVVNPGLLTLNAGTGTHGLQLTQFPNPLTTVTTPSRGTFYAYQASPLDHLSFIAVSWASEDEDLPDNSVAVTLIPQCVNDYAGEDPYASTVDCYENVAAIDWTVYSAS